MSKLKSAILAIALSGCFAPPPIGGEGDLVDNDGDGFTADVDCDNTREDINSGATEICDSVDNDCDGLADEGCETPVDDDLDNDGYETPADCNDGNPSVHPGATEICDGLDNNCSGGSDEGLTLAFYRDADGDGYGRDVATPIMACTAPTGYVPNNGDCDDSQALRAPNKPELCDNGIDNDCDGLVDSEDPSVSGGECADAVGEEDCFRDIDGDGYGRTPSVSYQTCPDGWVEQNHDCDDSVASRHPGADENCQNNLDDDCDGTVNDGCPTGPVCTPTGAEICGDGRDNDCNAATTDVCPVCVPTGVEICGNSIDEDCVGGANACPVCVPTGVEICGNGVDEDCNASTTDVCTPTCVPTGPEVCGNGVNEDCNASTSDTCPVTPTKACYEDRDNDGYGANGHVTQRATCLSTESEEAGDCEDGDALRFPELMEVQDLRDNDCDGMTDEDGLVTFRRYYRTPGVDWDHLFATSTPAGGYSQDDKWMKIYPVNICSGTYRPFDTCVVNGNGATVTLHGGNQLEALSQCRGLIGEDDITLLLLEGSGEYRDYSVRSGFSCSRLGYAMSQTGSARQSFGTLAKLLWRHRSSPFVDFGVGGRPGVADNMWSTLPLEGEVGHGGTSTDLDYDEHTAAFYVPYAR